MARALQLKVPGKINLFLHVTGRRPDGYHTLESIFCPIAWYDVLTLSLQPAPGVQLDGGMPGLPPDQDLSVRAARSLLEALGLSHTTGVQITLEKHIPAGAGLGGGSADAAYTLLGLNALLDYPLSPARLHTLATPLGADVPFFLLGQPAFAGGIGEDLSPLPLPAIPVVLIKPPAHLSTPRVFSHPDLTRDAPSVKMLVFGFSDATQLLQYLGEQTTNALQTPAQQLSADIAAATGLFDRLPIDARPLWRRMTGSGSAVFGVFANAKAAKMAAGQIEQWVNADRMQGWQVRCTQTLPTASLNNQTVHLL